MFSCEDFACSPARMSRWASLALGSKFSGTWIKPPRRDFTAVRPVPAVNPAVSVSDFTSPALAPGPAPGSEYFSVSVCVRAVGSLLAFVRVASLLLVSSPKLPGFAMMLELTADVVSLCDVVDVFEVFELGFRV